MIVDPQPLPIGLEHMDEDPVVAIDLRVRRDVEPIRQLERIANRHAFAAERARRRGDGRVRVSSCFAATGEQDGGTSAHTRTEVCLNIIDAERREAKKQGIAFLQLSQGICNMLAFARSTVCCCRSAGRDVSFRLVRDLIKRP